MKDKIYITGHRHPDTDSIASSIAYAYLKNELGFHAVGCRLGDINDETRYLLNRFNIKEPNLLEDARAKLEDIELGANVSISKNATIFEAMRIMDTLDQTYLAAEDYNKVVGIITKGDIGKIGLGDTAFGIDLLKGIDIKDLNRTINGTLCFEAERTHLNGKVSIVTISSNKAKHYEVEDRIVIVGDDIQAQKELIQKGAGVLIVVWAESIDREVLELARMNQCSVLISGFGAMNTSRYLYFSVKVSEMMKTDIMAFYKDEYVENVVKKMRKNRYRGYPVLDRDNKLIGYVHRNDVMHINNKKIILVDHNEFSQSVPYIEKADILEVVDHHRIYDFYTAKPIQFRNEIVGSSATIITSMFLENRITIPKDLAGLLLGAILSDTLNFQSPTCTQKDLNIANYLEEITGLNSEELAYDMFFVSSNIKGKSVNEVLEEDVKVFDIEQYKVMITQVIVPSKSLMEDLDWNIEEELKAHVHKNGYDLGVLCFTCILDGGSLFYVSGKISRWISPNKKPFFMDNVLSRKNQILPMITNIISQNKD